MFKITINPQTTHMKHAYAVIDKKTGDIIYTGVDTLPNAITLQKIANLNEFDNRRDYDVHILGAFEREGHALNALNYHYGSICPKLNVLANQGSTYMRGRLIYCNETGQVFLSQVEAAKHFGIAQANISRHLKKRPGFTNCKGYTFRYLNQAEGQELQSKGLLIDKNGANL